MQKAGLMAIVINSDTLDAARRVGRRLWEEARSKVTMVLVSPEKLKSKEFGDLLNTDVFWERVFAMGADEAHLMYFWGASFRPRFHQIGFMRARLPSRGSARTPLIALTATLRAGSPKDCICSFLGLREGKYHFIRLSNRRDDIQFIFRNMRSGMKSTAFPELDWVLTDGQRIIIFCATIALGFHVICYLWDLAERINFSNRGQRIRMYNSLNWPSFNSETLGFLNNNNEAQLIVATDTLSVGINSPADTIINFGLPSSPEDLVQKYGRIRKPRGKARGITYLPRGSLLAARNVVEANCQERMPQVVSPMAPTEETEENADQKRKRKKKPMDLGVANLILAPCIPLQLDREFDNPTQDKPCFCSSCRDKPLLLPKEKCDCSGCQPEVKPRPKGKTTKKTPPSVPVAVEKPLTASMRKVGGMRLKEFRDQVWDNAEEIKYGFLPPDAFVPDDVIKTFLDCFPSIRTLEDVHSIAQHHPLLNNHHHLLLAIIEELRDKFTTMPDEEQDDDDGVDELCDANDEIEGEIEVVEGKIKWRINASCVICVSLSV
jgi:Helicase conserved C-terminal domain